jgi:outer membrane protein OmpA-like peptidoglycan-associated protein
LKLINFGISNSPKAEPEASAAATSEISPAPAPSVAADSSPAGSPKASRQELPVQDEKQSERPSRDPASEQDIDSIRAAAEEIVTAFEWPEIRDKLNDPTTILVIGGYADLGGREDINLRISQERAENVSKILKEQAKVLNALQTVGMGGTDILDSTLPGQNRAVEVWAVVPF